jgi:hypothetical protein
MLHLQGIFCDWPINGTIIFSNRNISLANDKRILYNFDIITESEDMSLMKKILCVILLLFALVSCEKTQSPIQTELPANSQTSQPDDYVWQAEYHIVESGNFQAEHPVVVGDTAAGFQLVRDNN